MAVTQATNDKKGISAVTQADADGYFYQEWGSIRFYKGSGSPNAVITAPKGSMYVDVNATNLYMNTDASTTWELVSAQT